MKRNLIIISVLLFLIFATSRPVRAYLDPGTTGSIFSVFSGVLPAILAFLGLLVLPMKRVIKAILQKLKQRSRDGKQKSSDSGN